MDPMMARKSDLKSLLVRSAKWSALVALAHYVCTWLSLFGWIGFTGHMDESHSAARHAAAALLSGTHDVLLQPLAYSFRGESNTVVHMRLLLNSMLWGAVAGTLVLIGTSHRRKRVGHETRHELGNG
jgi:hypothetical protein